MKLGNVRDYSTNLNQTRARECKSLVYWGISLPCTVGVKLSPTELDNIKLANFIKSVMVGMLLSDGYILFSTKIKKKGSLGLTPFLAHSGYLYFVFNLLAHYCPISPVLIIRSRLDISSSSLYICTRSMACITELYHAYYANKIKVIKACIYNYLTPIPLAHLIKVEGTFNGITLLFCTELYSIVYVVRLINVLMIKYIIHCTIRYFKNRHPRIDVFKKDMVKNF